MIFFHIERVVIGKTVCLPIFARIRMKNQPAYVRCRLENYCIKRVCVWYLVFLSTSYKIIVLDGRFGALDVCFERTKTVAHSNRNLGSIKA